MRVIVTGSSGFIGSHVVRALEERGDRVIGLDKKTGVDLSADEAEGALLVHHPDAIIHCAGSASTPGSVSRPYSTLRDNVVTAAHVLEAARIQQVPLVITSSVKARDGMTPYGAAKRMVELWALEYRAAYQMPIIINRPGTVYGPGQEGSTESGWIAWFLKANLESLPVTINGDGNQVRDLLHVHDYVDLLLKQVDNPGPYTDQPFFDVGGGWDNAVSVLQIADFLKLDYAFGPPRYGDAEAYVALNDAPDWYPRTHWREGLTRLVTVPV